MSPNRDDGFSNLDGRKQGEKPSPGLRQADKSIPPTPPNIERASRRAPETWNPNWEGREETESWGTPYHHTEKFRAQEKAIGQSWGEARIRSEREERDAMVLGGSSPPRKRRLASKTILDEIDDPHGEVWNSMPAKERWEERRDERSEQDRFSLNMKSPKGYKTREVQLTRTYLWGDEESSTAGESVGVKVSWEPEVGSEAKPIVKTIRLNPSNIDEEGMTRDSDAMNPKGEAGPKKESTSAMKTRSSAKKGKVCMKRKPRQAASSAARSASPDDDTEAIQEKARKLKPKFRAGEIVRFRGDQALGEGRQPWRRGVITELITPVIR
jgi:hypothetical protein